MPPNLLTGSSLAIKTPSYSCALTIQMRPLVIMLTERLIFRFPHIDVPDKGVKDLELSSFVTGKGSLRVG
jgi:hypothetical protein